MQKILAHFHTHPESSVNGVGGDGIGVSVADLRIYENLKLSKNYIIQGKSIYSVELGNSGSYFYLNPDNIKGYFYNINYTGTWKN